MFPPHTSDHRRAPDLILSGATAGSDVHLTSEARLSADAPILCRRFMGLKRRPSPLDFAGLSSVSQCIYGGIMKTHVRKWGNSLALRIPKSFAKEAGLHADAAVELSLVQGKLLVQPVTPQPLTL